MIPNIKFNTRSTCAIILAGFFSLSISSCSQWNNTAKGGAAGAGAGAAIGGVIGSQSDDTGKGAVLGAAIGGVTGAAIGKYMDKQREDLEEEVGKEAEIERVGDGIVVTFDSGILFPFDSDRLKQKSRSSIQKVADVLEEYPETEVLIQGHTDDIGSEDYNLELSKERAQAVYDYATSLDIDEDRLIVEGVGESVPIASNDTEEGRRKNRRVEVIIYPSEELKQKAEDGDI